MAVPNFMAIPPIAVQTFQSGPKWVDRPTDIVLSLAWLKIVPTTINRGVETGNRRHRGNIYLKGSACVSSSLLSGTMTTLQSDWLSCWAYPWCFVASSNSS